MADERIIEGTWSCTSCGVRDIKARHKSCPGCGNPREESGAESEFDFGEKTAEGGLVRESVVDASALGLAAAGADWFCAYCSASNRGDEARCRTCSAEREPPKMRPLVSPAAVPRRSGYRFLPYILGCLALPFMALAALFLLGFWLTRTNDYEGTVTRVAWSLTTERETFTPTQTRGFKDTLVMKAPVMPQDGQGETAGLLNVHDCQRKQRGTRQVADGTERVCETKSRSVACGSERSCHTENLRNGFAKEVCENVTKYCDKSYQDCENRTRYRTEPVYGEECAYDTWEWRAAEQRTSTGAEDPPQWPDVAAGPLDRLVRKETYTLDVEYSKGGRHLTATHHPKTQEEFLAWRPGAHVTVVVDNGGTLKDIHAPGTSPAR
jgi:hypothetical protein